jgi:hypothetical protein
VKIPATLTIGAHRYTVQEDYTFSERGDLCGQVIYSQCLIRLAGRDDLNAPIARSQVEQAFCHEVIHAIDHVYCGGGQSKLSDAQTDQIAQGMYQVLLQMLEVQR